MSRKPIVWRLSFVYNTHCKQKPPQFINCGGLLFSWQIKISLQTMPNVCKLFFNYLTIFTLLIWL